MVRLKSGKSTANSPGPATPIADSLQAPASSKKTTNARKSAKANRDVESVPPTISKSVAYESGHVVDTIPATPIVSKRHRKAGDEPSGVQTSEITTKAQTEFTPKRPKQTSKLSSAPSADADAGSDDETLDISALVKLTAAAMTGQQSAASAAESGSGRVVASVHAEAPSLLAELDDMQLVVFFLLHISIFSYPDFLHSICVFTIISLLEAFCPFLHKASLFTSLLLHSLACSTLSTSLHTSLNNVPRLLVSKGKKLKAEIQVNSALLEATDVRNEQTIALNAARWSFFISKIFTRYVFL
jgi:hypothetical protein